MGNETWFNFAKMCYLSNENGLQFFTHGTWYARMGFFLCPFVLLMQIKVKRNRRLSAEFFPTQITFQCETLFGIMQRHVPLQATLWILFLANWTTENTTNDKYGNEFEICLNKTFTTYRLPGVGCAFWVWDFLFSSNSFWRYVGNLELKLSFDVVASLFSSFGSTKFGKNWIGSVL